MNVITNGLTNTLNHTRNKMASRIVEFAAETLAVGKFAKKLKEGLRRQGSVKDAIREVFPPGTTVTTWCEYCNKRIRNEIDHVKNIPSKYCSKTHQRKHRERNNRLREKNLKCPFPNKVSFPSTDIALKYWGSIIKDEPERATNVPYACICGRYHLGRIKYRIENEG